MHSRGSLIKAELMEEEHKNAKKQKHKMSYYKYSEANSAKIKLMPET